MKIINSESPVFTNMSINPGFQIVCDEITVCISQSAGLVRIDVVLYKALGQATNSLYGSANTVDVADGLTTALDLQNPAINDLRGQGAQTLILKITPGRRDIVPYILYLSARGKIHMSLKFKPF
jgi:hypothetical protein